MARKARRLLAGDLHHVTTRGNRRQAIFVNDDERRWFLGALDEACEHTGVRVLAWCLMGNHLHLVLAGRIEDVSAMMKRLLERYAMRVNRLHELDGHLVQGRFHSVPIVGAAQLRATLAYVLRNPVSAGLVARALEWPWSSLAATLGLARPPACLDVEAVLDLYEGDSVRLLARVDIGVAPARDDRNVLLAAMRDGASCRELAARLGSSAATVWRAVQPDGAAAAS